MCVSSKQALNAAVLRILRQNSAHISLDFFVNCLVRGGSVPEKDNTSDVWKEVFILVRTNLDQRENGVVSWHVILFFYFLLLLAVSLLVQSAEDWKDI